MASTQGEPPHEATHQLGVLGAHRVGVLQQGLELVVLGECDDLQDRAELGEDLKGRAA